MVWETIRTDLLPLKSLIAEMQTGESEQSGTIQQGDSSALSKEPPAGGHRSTCRADAFIPATDTLLADVFRDLPDGVDD